MIKNKVTTTKTLIIDKQRTSNARISIILGFIELLACDANTVQEFWIWELADGLVERICAVELLPHAMLITEFKKDTLSQKHTGTQTYTYNTYTHARTHTQTHITHIPHIMSYIHTHANT